MNDQNEPKTMHPTQKKRYEAPKIVPLGSAAALLAGGAGSAPEGMGTFFPG